VLVGGAAIVASLAIAVVLVARRTRRIDLRLLGLTRGVEGHSLEAVLDAHLDKVFSVASELDELAAKMAVLEAVQRRTFQKVGLVRYNRGRARRQPGDRRVPRAVRRRGCAPPGR